MLDSQINELDFQSAEYQISEDDLPQIYKIMLNKIDSIESRYDYYISIREKLLAEEPLHGEDYEEYAVLSNELIEKMCEARDCQMETDRSPYLIFYQISARKLYLRFKSFYEIFDLPSNDPILIEEYDYGNKYEFEYDYEFGY